MKRFLKIAVVCCIVLIFTLALVACNDKDTHKGKFEEVINDVDDLKKISVKLGADYDQGTFILENDLIVEGEWETIGTSVESSFRGTLNGNGKTITYDIVIPEPDTRYYEDTLVGEKFYGLFGVIHNATIYDLNLVVNVQVPANSNIVYVGGLAGFMSGNNDVRNVNVSGNIRVTIGNICNDNNQDDNQESTDLERYSMTGFVGGVAGFINGQTTVENLTSSVYVDVESYDDGRYNCALKNLFIGGVAGSMRTVNLSSTRDNAEYGVAKNLTYNGSLDATAEYLNIGGIFGAVYRIQNGEKWIVNASSIIANAKERLRVGGVAGIVDRVDLNKTKATVSSLKASYVSEINEKQIINVGGVCGYAANYSKITNAVSDVNDVDVADGSKNYVGGIVGTCASSSIDTAVATGNLYYFETSVLNVQINYGTDKRENYSRIFSGGIVGRAYGETTINNVATTFSAYQGLVGEIDEAIEIVTIKDGDTIENWLANTVYDLTKITYVVDSGVQEEGETQYRITHKYSINNENSTYSVDKIRIEKDILSDAEIAEKRNDFGVGVSDTSSYDALLSSITNSINQ